MFYDAYTLDTHTHARQKTKRRIVQRIRHSAVGASDVMLIVMLSKPQTFSYADRVWVFGAINNNHIQAQDNLENMISGCGVLLKSINIAIIKIYNNFIQRRAKRVLARSPRNSRKKLCNHHKPHAQMYNNNCALHLWITKIQRQSFCYKYWGSSRHTFICNAHMINKWNSFSNLAKEMAPFVS